MSLELLDYLDLCSFLVGLPAFSPTATNTNAWVRTLCRRGGCVEQMGVALGKEGLRWASGGCVGQEGVALGKRGLRWAGLR